MAALRGRQDTDERRLAGPEGLVAHCPGLDIHVLHRSGLPAWLVVQLLDSGQVSLEPFVICLLFVVQYSTVLEYCTVGTWIGYFEASRVPRGACCARNATLRMIPHWRMAALAFWQKQHVPMFS